ncbi:GDP-mannose-dependent alpha-(1-6)-phosphatidylinositol monomannoside mannosyltransferase [Phaeobacter sp. CECT 5382]|uniref:glycosyltransferase n=1 Tax=Phaeobacter sp. CECT 5382 TaxID=1712645 RepID=UPI0006D9720F|nr:glycosyltransferase [Phaeobacter sp. CECT 5382]CUH87514.1 GDP-mannose-dependent alpha-(1-6)-phosphatidylinositol monomannoside mannosyltransferase [Phaeobacter sp. CECT 5382]
MKIAYVLNSYPEPSHSFIRREIQALERQGLEVLRLPMRPGSAPLVDPGDQDEAARSHYVLQVGALGLFSCFLRQLVRAPRMTLAALRLAWRLGRRSQSGVLRHLIYLLEAAYVARRCAVEGVDHMHAHFGTNATTVALLAHVLGGPGYSFTTHGPEEFDAPQALSLGLKVNRSRFAVAISSFGKSQLSRWADFGAWERLKVVHCGIEPARFADPVPLPEGPLRLAAIGRFVEQKGQMVLVKAMAQVVQSHPEVHLSLIGDGEMRADLEVAIAAAGLERNITFTGWLAEQGVRAELAAAHALVMPSFAEGLPMVVMEAMAAARPVLATYIAGTPELVLPSKTGWLVPAGDARVLAAAIVELAETPRPTLEAMGQAGRARVLQRHDSDVEAAKLAELFRAAQGASRKDR